MLEVKNLCCIRDERILFHKLSFTITPGVVLQIEGVNGAGKSSLLRALAGFLRPEVGQILWRGENITRQLSYYHQELLFIGHLAGLKAQLSPFENLSFYQASPKGCQRQLLLQALEQVGLLGYENVPLMQLSAGQKRRVALARLYLSNHSLWILDEPFTAIDKPGAASLITLLAKHSERGGMIVLTTHQDLPINTCHVDKLSLQHFQA